MRLGVDKAHMRSTLTAVGIPVPTHAILDTSGATPLIKQVEAFGTARGWPLVLKACRGGYDGKGVWPVTDITEAAAVCAGAEATGVPLLVETHVAIDFELSALVVRRPGETLAWPVVETAQLDGVCREVLMPGRVTPELAARAQAIAIKIAETIDSVGVMAVEMFASRDALLVNEVALRPHNSGHWTIEGARTSQFEQHLRAVLDLPLGSPVMAARHAVMVNVLGGDDPDMYGRLVHVMAADPGVKVHLYGKAVRPGRKVGHVTAVGDDVEDLRGRARRAASYLRDGTEQD
jgi:5-(carboxyamino)imidazole ribonucleotide synthase